MFQPARWSPLLLLLAFAGCTSVPRPPQNGERPPDIDLAPQAPRTMPSPAPVPARIAATNLPPPPPALVAPKETWVPLKRWVESNRVGTVTNLNSQYPPTFALLTPAGTLAVRSGSQLARWSGIEVRLGHPPKAINGDLFLHTLDVQKNLMPLLEKSAGTNGPRILVLDPGHGGQDSGTRSALPGKWEKEYTLDLAQRLKPLLEAAGWEVHLTRTNDVDVPLQSRVEFADECKADLFLSLHFNAIASASQAGVETYCITPVGLHSTVTRGYEDDPTLTFPNNRFDTQNLQLAVRLHRAVLAATGGQDRGVRRARFLTVLRGQNRPAVLIEAGYLSNPVEAKAIDTPDYRQKLAEFIARALQES